MNKTCSHCGAKVTFDTQNYCSSACRRLGLHEKLNKVIDSHFESPKKVAKPKPLKYKCRICGGLTTQPFRRWDTAESSTYFCTEYCWDVFKSQLRLINTEHRLHKRRMARVAVPLEEDIAWEDIKHEDS